MLRVYTSVAFIFISSVLCAQQEKSIAILSRSKADGVWLRWAPTNVVNWQLGNKYGYTIERFTLKADGELEANSQLNLTPTPIKPFTPAEFLPFSERSDEVATLEELLYGESSVASGGANDLPAIMAKNNALQNNYGIAMLMCDLSIDAAAAGGLFFRDSKAVMGQRYIYRISLNYKSSSVSIEPSVIIVSHTEEKPLLQINDLAAEFGNKTVTLKWRTLLHKGIYTAYFIERSSDGKTYSKVTDLPYVHMSEKLESEEAVYVDSLEANQKKYFYRIQGISPFSEIGAYSNIVTGEGREPLSGELILREGKALDKTRIRLAWEFATRLENQIAGFVVSRANSPDGPYIDAFKKPMAKTLREFIDATTFNNTYYVVKAVDQNGNEITRSFPFLVQIEDTTPPATPTGLSGNVVESGAATLTWKPNTDFDLLGYRVFRSNATHEEPVEVTKEIISQPTFVDTINVRVLDKKVYYNIIAVDRNFNTSEYSAVFALARPDIIPPAAPVLLKTELTKDSVLLEWVNSVSNDIARYELTRFEKDNRLSRTILTWYPLTPVTKYADRSLTPGHTYSYRISVYDSAGNKSETSTQEILYEPGFRNAVAQIQSSVDREGKKITIQWKNSLPSVRCIVYKKVNNNPFTIYKTLDGNVESFTDQTININNVYSYKIQAVYTKGIKSMISEEVKIIY